MISISHKSQCSGCGACAQRCPQSCIELKADGHGFFYPVVDADRCVDCHLCEKVCPFLNEKVQQEPVECFAAVNVHPEIRWDSSSGGLFTLLAQCVLASGGVVFGARFDADLTVVHDFTDTVDGLAAFRGSKYVQSVIGDNYKKAEAFLKQGKEVLFSGTPCQIAGLKQYLGKDYDKLTAVEVVCHGVPSPKVWKEYLGGKARNIQASDVSFRDKSTGWRDYSVRIGSTKRRHDYDHYMGCFLGNYSLRQSCFNCPVKSGRSGADIILGDLWGICDIAPSLNDDKGTSLVIVNTGQGMRLVERSGVEKLVPVQYEKAVSHNQAVQHSPVKPTDYDGFWRLFEQSPAHAIKEYGGRFTPGLKVRIKQVLRRWFFPKVF